MSQERVTTPCEFVDQYEAHRLRAWPIVEAFFKTLPDSLQDIAWNFAQRLARQTAPSGEFKDSLKHPAAARVVYLPFWHAASYLNQGLLVDAEDDFCSHLFASSFLGFCAIRIHDDVIDGDQPETPIDVLLLAHLFTIEATRHLQIVFPSDSPLWKHHLRHWSEYTHAVRLDKLRDLKGVAEFSTTDLLHIGRKAALLKTYLVAVALRFGKEEQIDAIEVMMDNFNTAIQINNDIQSIRTDLETPHYTPPLSGAILAAGIKLETHPTREEMKGSLILSNAVVESHSLAKMYYMRAKDISVELGIDDLTSFIEWHLDDLQTSEDYWQDVSVDMTKLPASFIDAFCDSESVVPLVPGLDRSLEMAIEFLQFDPESRESWEIQRTGIWGKSTLVGDVFSRSLIVESLAKMNMVLPDQVEEILLQYKENGWRYYREFKALPPDIDDIAQAIRLVRYADWDIETKCAYLAQPLRWLKDNRTSDGRFLVWLTENIDDKPEAGWISLGGMSCLACEANLLEALADVSNIPDCWIAEGLANLVLQWDKQYHNGIYYYKPDYGEYLIARCFARFCCDTRISVETKNHLRHQLKDMEVKPDTLLVGADPLAQASRLQQYVLLSKSRDQEVLKPADRLMGAQSFDGGWHATAFFRCPGNIPGRIGWHAGRLLTTAQVAVALYNLKRTVM